MTTITVDFSNLPSDTAMILAQQPAVHDLAVALARDLRVPPAERGMVRDDLIGTMAEMADRYLP